jgi:hypothetical protein
MEKCIKESNRELKKLKYKINIQLKQEDHFDDFSMSVKLKKIKKDFV